jgi:hypothetical protein
MDGYPLVKSRRLQLAVALLHATLVVVWVMWAIGENASVAIPILMMALGLPLLLRLVPRNYLYGMRSARSLWTDEATWYRQNFITGAVMVLVGSVWLVVLALL